MKITESFSSQIKKFIKPDSYEIETREFEAYEDAEQFCDKNGLPTESIGQDWSVKYAKVYRYLISKVVYDADLWEKYGVEKPEFVQSAILTIQDPETISTGNVTKWFNDHKKELGFKSNVFIKEYTSNIKNVEYDKVFWDIVPPIKENESLENKMNESISDNYYLEKSSGLWGIVKLEGDDKLYLKSFKDETPEWTKDKIYAVKFKKDEAKEVMKKLYQKDNDTKEDGSLEEEYRSWNVSEPSMFSNIEPNLEIPETDKEIIKNKYYGYGYIDKISDDGTIYAVFGNKVRLFPQDAFEKGYVVKMNEAIKEELDQVGAGISSMFMDLINQEYSLLSQYESAQVTLNDLGENRFDDVLDYIKDDINIHIGMLQASIEDINPSAEKIDDGKEEADKLILDESLFKF